MKNDKFIIKEDNVLFLELKSSAFICHINKTCKRVERLLSVFKTEYYQNIRFAIRKYYFITCMQSRGFI